jgi:hypothetical protein
MTDEQITALVARLRYTAENGMFVAQDHGLLARPIEAADMIEMLMAELAAEDAENDKWQDVYLAVLAERDAARAERDAQAAEIARLRAGIAGVKARGITMQADAYTDGEKYIGYGWECAGEWLEALAQETQS